MPSKSFLDCAHTIRHASHYSALLARKTYPGLHRIFKNANLVVGAMKKLLEMIQMASEGKYHAKAAFYDHPLHFLHVPPFSSVARTLSYTIGPPKILDILANIETMFEDIPPKHYKVPITMSMDEVATDFRLCYLPETDETAGFCEHAATKVPSAKMVKDLTTIHYPHTLCMMERSMLQRKSAAFARNDEINYGANPVLIMPTCKKSVYHMENLSAIASDSDPKRRPALSTLHVPRMTPADSVFKYLCNLPALNLWIGPGGETRDLD